jgi:hypothetical protein
MNATVFSAIGALPARAYHPGRVRPSRNDFSNGRRRRRQLGLSSAAPRPLHPRRRCGVGAVGTALDRSAIERRAGSGAPVTDTFRNGWPLARIGPSFGAHETARQRPLTRAGWWGSDEPAVHRVAVSAFHDLRIGQLDMQHRLEPRDAARESEIMKRRHRACASASEQIFAVRRPMPHSTVPRKNRRRPRRSPTSRPANVTGRPRIPPITIRPSRRILHLIQLDDRPGAEPLLGQSARRVDHAGALRLVLEHVSASVQGEATDVETVEVQAIERHERGRRTWLVSLAAIEQVELRDEVLIEHAYLAVEDQRRCFERADRVGELAETTEGPDDRAVLVASVGAIGRFRFFWCSFRFSRASSTGTRSSPCGRCSVTNSSRSASRVCLRRKGS